MNEYQIVTRVNGLATIISVSGYGYQRGCCLKCIEVFSAFDAEQWSKYEVLEIRSGIATVIRFDQKHTWNRGFLTLSHDREERQERFAEFDAYIKMGMDLPLPTSQPAPAKHDVLANKVIIDELQNQITTLQHQIKDLQDKYSNDDYHLALLLDQVNKFKDPWSFGQLVLAVKDGSVSSTLGARLDRLERSWVSPKNKLRKQFAWWAVVLVVSLASVAWFVLSIIMDCDPELLR